jgi:uncharacterized membrane protein
MPSDPSSGSRPSADIDPALITLLSTVDAMFLCSKKLMSAYDLLWSIILTGDYSMDEGDALCVVASDCKSVASMLHERANTNATSAETVERGLREQSPWKWPRMPLQQSQEDHSRRKRESDETRDGSVE